MKHLKENFLLNCAVAAAGGFLLGSFVPLSTYIGNFREFSSTLPVNMLLYVSLGGCAFFVCIFCLLCAVTLAGKKSMAISQFSFLPC